MKKMSIIKKIILAAVSAVAVIALIYFAYTTIHYRMFRDYQDYLSDNEPYEEGAPFQPLAGDGRIKGMELAAQNGQLELYINKATAEFAVYDRRTDAVVYSNPEDADQDALASKTNKAYLKSQLIVDFYNANRKSTTYNSFEYCTSLGQFALESIPDGVRVIYTIGDMSSKTGIVPIYITSERLESFLANLSEKDAKYVRFRFSEKSDIDGFLMLPESVQTAPAQMRKLNEHMANAGYTEEDFRADMEEAGADGAVPTNFVIPVEYTLQEDGLRVRIPVEQIQEHGDGMLYRIQLLRFFGASGMDEDGYIVVPNGAGSIINFNNGKTDAGEYNQFIYGIDPVAAEYLVRENTEQVRMPVFGMYYRNTGTGMLAVIEKSESHAAVTASISGKVNSYNYVYPTFTLRGSDTLAMFGTTGNEADIPIIEKNIYGSDIIVRYSMMTKEHDGYSGMARYYREKLEAEGKLKRLAQTSDIPFYMDLIGGVKKTAYFLGSQYLDVFPMTDYEEAEKIVDDLAAGGVHRLVVNYQGWFNDGYYHDAASKIKLVKELGSKKELEKLTDKIEAAGGRLYGDVAFQKLSFIADNYDYTRESSRYYGAGYTVSFGQVNPISLKQTSGLGYRETLYNIISPKFLVRYVSKFSDRINKYDISGISLRDLTDMLASDKRRTEVIVRDEALDIVEAMIQKLGGTGKALMGSGGNAYSWAYMNDLINIPTSGNDFAIIDQDIPFYQMVVHGYIDYSGSAINLDDSFDRVDSVLTMIEYGAAPHFTFTWESSSEMKYTGLNSMYSTTYKNRSDVDGSGTLYSWDELAKSVYGEVNAVLRQVSSAAMTRHEFLPSGVAKITYDNGVIIYVNRQSSAADADGEMLAAKSYQVRGAGK